MKLAICQINPSLGDLEKNKLKILKYIDKSCALNPDIIVFPELSLCGYPPLDLLREESFIKENKNALQEIASFCTVPAIIGCIRSEGSKLYNSAAVCFDNKLQEYYDKILLPNYDVFDEKRFFTPGKAPKPILVPVRGQKRKIGLQICEDLWDEQYSCKVSDIQKELGAELIVNISASPYSKNKIKERKYLVSSKAGRLGIPFIYCNIIGGQDELIFDGSSFAVTKEGSVLSESISFAEELKIVNLKQYKKNISKSISIEEEIFNALSLGVKDYFYKTGHEKAVLGLSGGIDSALVASIAVNALGNKNVCGISLPSKFSSKHSLIDARQLAANLKIDYQVIKIHSLVQSFHETLKPNFRSKDPNIAEENIQSRIRGNLLMALANKFGWLVLSTGNKTELALGYCTLYGDLIGALSVIADLSKNDVYALSKWINQNKNNCIPLNSIDKPPSAELAPNQTDPFDYSIISPLVDDIIEKKKTINMLIDEGYEKKLVYDIYKKIKINEFKRRQAPPVLRVTSKAFGIGRRFPIINNFSG